MCNYVLELAIILVVSLTAKACDRKVQWNFGSKTYKEFHTLKHETVAAAKEILKLTETG